MPTETTREIGGRYRLGERLGRGGMGIVWRAEDPVLQRPVAVKEVDIPSGLSDPERAALEARVMREARAAARLNHPNVVTVFDVIEDEGRTFIVMELVEAPSLADVIEREGPVDVARAAQIGLDVLGALEAAHAEGIVHRDVKPANVLIAAGGRAKLGDFGIASVKDDPKITSTGLILGSPSYMAPEQASEGTSGPAADLWALGALLYFAVEGAPPFDKGQPLPTLAAVVGESHRPMERGVALGGIVDRLLEKEPSDRPGPGEIRRALEQVGRAAATTAGGPVTAPDLVPDGARPSRAATRPVVPEPVTRPPTSRRSPALWVLGAGLLIVAAIALWALMNIDAAPEQGRGERRARQAAEGAEADGGGESGGSLGTGDAGQVDTSGWTSYTDEATGYTISHPPDWSVSPVDDTRTDFVDPVTGSYLRIDWTDAPGDDPVAAWESFEEDFAASHEGYERITIEPTSFKGMEAAWWEFTYTDGGRELHAVDLGFVTNDQAYGFALNFQTPAEDWEASQDTFSAFQQSFQVPS